MDKYNENKGYLPNDYQEVIIEGGCHEYFGMYGNQKVLELLQLLVKNRYP